MRAILPSVAFALLLAACGGGNASNANERPFRVGLVDRGEIRVIVEETGVVEPERQVVVKSPISGIVQRLLVREGDRVTSGQLLARIVPDMAQANTLARLRSEVNGARINLERASREYERLRDLAASGGVTQEELESRRTAWEQAGNTMKAAEDQLRMVELSGVIAADTAQWARITAPSAGVIIRRGVEEGETVVGGTSTFGGGTEIFTIADLSALRVKAAINEVDIAKVAVGDSVALTVDAFPDDTALGIVRLVPPAARPQDRVRVFDVEITVVSGDKLRPGMTANVRIAGPVRRDAVRVPVEAVFLREGRPVVHRVRGGPHETVAVTLGLGDLRFVEISSGLATGDTVALEDPVAASQRASSITRRP